MNQKNTFDIDNAVLTAMTQPQWAHFGIMSPQQGRRAFRQMLRKRECTDDELTMLGGPTNMYCFIVKHFPSLFTQDFS
jgi:hypothetical protein